MERATGDRGDDKLFQFFLGRGARPVRAQRSGAMRARGAGACGLGVVRALACGPMRHAAHELRPHATAATRAGTLTSWHFFQVLVLHDRCSHGPNVRGDVLQAHSTVFLLLLTEVSALYMPQ
jgi:hypothetical protein